MKKNKKWFLAAAAALSLVLSACGQTLTVSVNTSDLSAEVQSAFSEDLSLLPGISEYTDQPYTVVNDNIPYFEDSELTDTGFESYSDLDDLGRCGTAYASVGLETLPNEERGNIGQVKPTGWQTVKYDHVDGKYLYNRCHLIGFQLTGENANEKNLITGTRYFNTQGMLPFENMVADYVKETENHVMYRVTPVFEGDNLVASGVLMEAKSVEDDGEGILFCVYVYNIEPGVVINYSTGESALDEAESGQDAGRNDYILNTSSKKFHEPGCSSVDQIKESNKKEFSGDRNDLISQGYDPCKNCSP